MFTCISCTEKYTEEDVKAGKYSPSTSTCVHCYKRMSKSKVSCFAKEELYDISTIACGQECMDSIICRSFIKHKEEYKGE